MRHGAVRAVPSADIAEDHEGRGAMLPALAGVRTMGFLADSVQVERPHQLLEPQVVGPARRSDFQPARLPLGKGLDAMAPHYLIERVAHWEGVIYPGRFQAVARITVKSQ